MAREIAKKRTNNLKNGVAMFSLKTNAPIIPMKLIKTPKIFRRNTLIIGEPFCLEQVEGEAFKETLEKATQIIKEKQQQLNIALEKGEKIKMFIMLAGSSGVGKNTLINDLKPKNSSVVLMPTLTTRAMRAGEVEGNPFYYLTKEEFEDKVKAGELFEHELIHGNFYGSSKIIFNEYLKSGKILMKDIGVEGAINLSRILKPFTNTIRVFFNY